MIKNKKGSWVFTQEEKKQIQTYISRVKRRAELYNPERFIRLLEFACQMKRHSNFMRLPTESKARVKINSIINTCTNTQDMLDRLGSEKSNAIYILPEKAAKVTPDDWMRSHALLDVWRNASEAAMALQHLCESLKELKGMYSQKAGRKPSDDTNFVADIALKYDTYISIPTTSRDGVFADIIRLCYEAVNKKHKAPEPDIMRAIKQGIEKMRTYKNAEKFKTLIV